MTEERTPEANNVLVESLGSALRRGGNSLAAVPGLLKQVLTEGSWREFTTRRGEHVKHERFAEFVTVEPLRGLGANIDIVRRIVADDPKAIDLLDQVLQNPVGNHHDSDIITITDNAGGRGTSTDYALRRLRKDAPELHAEVIGGNLSAHAAMVKAGFRPRTFTVRPDPESAARTLRKYMSPEQLAQLARLIAEES